MRPMTAGTSLSEAALGRPSLLAFTVRSGGCYHFTVRSGHQHRHPAPAPATCLHHVHSQLTAPAPAPAPGNSTSNLSPQRAQPAHSTSTGNRHQHQQPVPQPAHSTSTSTGAQRQQPVSACLESARKNPIASLSGEKPRSNRCCHRLVSCARDSPSPNLWRSRLKASCDGTWL